jgi:hypothetical protein
MPLSKLVGVTAAEICARYAPDEAATSLLAAGATPAAFLDALRGAGALTEAVRFLAFALPAREGAWWAYLSARDAAAAKPDSNHAACLDAIEAWVYKPSDEARRAVFPLGEAAGFDTPTGYAALAVFWSGGSIAPPDLDPIEPDAKLAPTAVGAAVLASALVPDVAGAKDRYRRAIERGIDIAGGGSGRFT